MLDEAQFVKNPYGKGFECAMKLPTPFKLAITGTPMENNLAELWSLCTITMPGIFGVFYYRSANPRTLEALESFLPVPAEQLTAEFGAGATPEEICARTIRALREAGARHFYISNLPLQRAARTLSSVLSKVRT